MLTAGQGFGGPAAVDSGASVAPRLIHPAARPVLFTVAVFYIFDSVLSLFLAVPLVDRLAFLVLDIVASSFDLAVEARSGETVIH
jgi:hypothetical protein